MKIKRIVIAMVLIAGVFLMCACSKSNENSILIKSDVHVEDIKNEIVQTIELPEMVDATADNISMMYDLDSSTFIEFSIIYAGSGGSADEIAIIKLNTKDEVKNIKSVMEKRIADRTQAFQGYAPLESAKLGKAIVKTKGNYVFLAICDDSKAAAEIFDKALK